MRTESTTTYWNPRKSRRDFEDAEEELADRGEDVVEWRRTDMTGNAQLEPLSLD